MTTTDWRGLCEELVNELHGYASANPHHDSDALVARARAALSQPESEVGPTDEELDAMERQCYIATEVCNDSGCEYVFEHRRFARAAIAADRARWGRPAPAAEGEVAELMEWLRIQAIKWKAIDQEAGLTRSLVAEHFTRAADLLERRP